MVSDRPNTTNPFKDPKNPAKDSVEFERGVTATFRQLIRESKNGDIFRDLASEENVNMKKVYIILFGRGGGGQVVIVLAFNYHNLNSDPTDVFRYIMLIALKEQQLTKRGCEWRIKKISWRKFS